MTTAPDPAPPLTEEELAQYRDLIDMHRQYGPALSIEGEARLLAELDRLRAELAETRRVADHNQAGLVKALDESAAENAALAEAVKTVATALDNLGGRVYRDFNSDYSEVADSVILREFNAYAEGQLAVLDDSAVRAALGETGGTDA